MLFPPWVKPALYGTALVLAFSAGWTVQGWRWEAKQTAALDAQQKAHDRQLAKQNTVAAEYEADRETGRVEARTRETQIRRIYETVEVPAECEPGPDALRVLDQAVDSANQRTGQPDAAVPPASAEARAVPRS